jgi:hypothetical protein
MKATHMTHKRAASKIVSTLVLSLFASAAMASDPKAAIEALDAKLAKLGAPKVEGTAKVGDKDLPALFYGSRRINSNYDIVDDIKKTTGAAATVFVKDGDEFIRISTNVLTPAGARGITTPLARAKAYEAVASGKSFCGMVDVLGTQFDACYNPIKDGAGKVVGATYVGFKK